LVEAIEGMEKDGGKILKMFIREVEVGEERAIEMESRQLNYGDLELLEQSIASSIDDVSTRFLIIDNEE
jgi:hypothetical protein